MSSLAAETCANNSLLVGKFVLLMPVKTRSPSITVPNYGHVLLLAHTTRSHTLPLGPNHMSINYVLDFVSHS